MNLLEAAYEILRHSKRPLHYTENHQPRSNRQSNRPPRADT